MPSHFIKKSVSFEIRLLGPAKERSKFFGKPEGEENLSAYINALLKEDLGLELGGSEEAALEKARKYGAPNSSLGVNYRTSDPLPDSRHKPNTQSDSPIDAAALRALAAGAEEVKKRSRGQRGGK